jgi:hypothetical protein
MLASGLLALGAICFWQQIKQHRQAGEIANLRRELQQASSLREDNIDLTNRLKLAQERSEAEHAELLRLRGQAATSRQLAEENRHLKSAAERVATNQPVTAQPTDNPFDSQHGPGASLHVEQAKHWGFALINYAANHDSLFPQSLAEAAPFLHDELREDQKKQTTDAAERYEILYRGLRTDLEKLPPESTIIVREKEPWLDQQGRWCKAYCFSDGSASIRVSRQNDFDQWEALRIPKRRE